MITLEQVENYARQKFNEEDSSDRVHDNEFAYSITTQPREYLDTQDRDKMTVGNGQFIVLKETGDVYSFFLKPYLYVWCCRCKNNKRVQLSLART